MKGMQVQQTPTLIFKEWIQKNGKAQKEFMSLFTDIMNKSAENKTNPLDVLKEFTQKTSKMQNEMLSEMYSTQSKSIAKMMNFGLDLTNLLTKSTFKASIGSNGRISIPEVERSALGLKEGDLVQVVLIPMNKKSKNNFKKT